MHPFSKAFGNFYKYLCVIIVALMVLIVFINTVLRYCFNSGLVENEEVLRYLFIWATFLGIVAVYYEGNHISVTMFTDRLPRKIGHIFSLAASCLVLYAMYILVNGSIMYIADSESTVGQMTNLPYVYIISASVFAGIACTFIVLKDMYKHVCALRTDSEEK